MPFAERAKLFKVEVAAEREEARTAPEDIFEHIGNRFHSVKRGQLLMDGFAEMNGLAHRLKGPIRVQVTRPRGCAAQGPEPP